MTSPSSPSIDKDNLLLNLYWKQISKTAADIETADTAKSIIEAISAINAKFKLAESAINTNQDLSAKGRVSAMLTLANTSIDSVQKISAPTITKLNEIIVSATSAMRNYALGADATVITELRAIETRSLFSQLDDITQRLNYLQLCENGIDDASCVAVENYTSLSPVLSADVIEQGRKIRGARALPDQASALANAMELRSILVSTAKTVEHDMARGRMLDPLQVSALGFQSDESSDDNDALQVA